MLTFFKKFSSVRCKFTTPPPYELAGTRTRDERAFIGAPLISALHLRLFLCYILRARSVPLCVIKKAVFKKKCFFLFFFRLSLCIALCLAASTGDSDCDRKERGEEVERKQGEKPWEKKKGRKKVETSFLSFIF